MSQHRIYYFLLHWRFFRWKSTEIQEIHLRNLDGACLHHYYVDHYLGGKTWLSFQHVRIRDQFIIVPRKRHARRYALVTKK